MLLASHEQEANAYQNFYVTMHLEQHMARASSMCMYTLISFKRSKHSDDFDRQMTSICPSLTATTRLSGLIMLITIFLRNDILLNSCWESCLQWRLWLWRLSRIPCRSRFCFTISPCVKICKFQLLISCNSNYCYMMIQLSRRST
jgi:hypothetical protein